MECFGGKLSSYCCRGGFRLWRLMSQLSILEILLKLTALKEAESRQLVNSVGASDLNLISGLGLLALHLILSISKLIIELISQVADQSIEVVQL